MSEMQQVLPRTEKSWRTIAFDLTSEDRSKMMIENTELESEIRELEAELTSMKKQTSSEIDKRREVQANNYKVTEAGRQEKNVECEIEKDYLGGVVKYYLDGKVVDERVMEASERQVRMPFDADPAALPEPEAVTDDRTELRDVIRSETSRHTKQDLTT